VQEEREENRKSVRCGNVRRGDGNIGKRAVATYLVGQPFYV
jgi:hypothetical protein